MSRWSLDAENHPNPRARAALRASENRKVVPLHSDADRKGTLAFREQEHQRAVDMLNRNRKRIRATGLMYWRRNR